MRTFLHFSKDHTDITTMWTFSTTPLTYQSGPALKLEVLVTSYTPLRLYTSSTGSSGPLEALSRPDLFAERVRMTNLIFLIQSIVRMLY